MRVIGFSILGFFSVKNYQIASNLWHKDTEDIMGLKWAIFKDKKSDEK